MTLEGEAKAEFPRSEVEGLGVKGGAELQAFGDSTDHDSLSERSRDERESLLCHPPGSASTIALSSLSPRDFENTSKDSETTSEEGRVEDAASAPLGDGRRPEERESLEKGGDFSPDVEGEAQSPVAAACRAVISAMKQDEFFAEASKLIRRERFRYLEGIRMMKEDHSYLDLSFEDNGTPSKLVALMDALAQDNSRCEGFNS
ncbi:conserved hypothetical protein [Neospora caninum Liverpool]|uniref:Uncharacterized protein n=1 Tax=Neospora caninum (strain Liverpool) TaxID=572307 RepID=F0V876_NEOCL|nr:conserved hypothetical protein [Neospora caninum Liverpool]CBZ49917.1 conserved hypothetical protein [Neospora caninum Liverpool]CEL64504.1 TPA: hypothetical protein BN1204_004010 [Neospora caninum Liverpool]|eukprot:XP_003879952.1 conserved hypothetical protein [Neospora caninum Liverpool]